MWKHIETNKYYKHTEILNPFLAIEQSEIIVKCVNEFYKTYTCIIIIGNNYNLKKGMLWNITQDQAQNFIELSTKELRKLKLLKIKS